MNSIAETCMHAFVWCCRVRHRRGYGVHSPYAYNLIKQVFFETETFYAYEELQHTVGRGRSFWQTKTDRLMLRLANEVQPQRIWVCGLQLDVPACYASAGCRRAKRIDWSEQTAVWPDNLQLQQPLVDFWMWEVKTLDLNRFEKMAATVAEPSVAVVFDIHRSRSALRLWKNIEHHPLSVVTFDLYDVGVVFFNRQYNKQSYKVCF